MAVAISQTANPAGANAASNIATYSSVSIGAAAADRIVVVLAATELASSTPSACTIDYGSGDTAMTSGTTGNFGAVFARAFYLRVTTGTTATIKVTYSSTNPTSVQNHISVYSVTGAALPSVGGDGSTDMDVTDPLTTGSITIPTNGGFLAVAAGATDTVAKTWANATEDLDADVGDFRYTTATRTTALTTTAVTCTGGTNGEDGAMSWLIFAEGLPPTVSLNTPSDSATGQSTTPTLDFTGTDANNDRIRFNVQILGGTSGSLEVDSYSEANQSSLLIMDGAVNNDRGVSQSFTAIGGKILSAKWYLRKFSSPTGNAVARLYAHSGTFGSSSIPTGSPLATSDNLDVSTLTTSLALKTFTFTGSEQYEMTAGTNYVLTVEYSGGDATNAIAAGYDSTAPTHAGNMSSLDDDNTTWKPGAGTNDACFYVYVGGYNKVSGTDSGFVNPDNGADTDPFLSGENIRFTVEAGDTLANSTTYYWRVRGIDPLGTNTYGAWSSTRSFTTTAGASNTTNFFHF